MVNVVIVRTVVRLVQEKFVLDVCLVLQWLTANVKSVQN